MAKQSIYLDHAAGAPIDKEVEKIVFDATAFFANPSGLHEEGIAVRQKIEEARKQIASSIGATAAEIIFTGNGTESNNLALRGLLSGNRQQHIVTTNIEHSSVLETCRQLVKDGVAVTFVPVEKNGIVDPKKIKEALQPNTILVSVMHANNEIGTIQPIGEIAKIIRAFRKEKNGALPYFHTDAVQAFNYLPTNVEKLGVDLLTLNGSKIYGPRGIGILYKRKGTPLEPILFGGNQEKGLRPGTENTPAILGLALAAKITAALREKERARLAELQDYFLKKLEESGLPFALNGDRASRLPNNVNISIAILSGDIWVIELSARGIAVSSKSACKEGSDAESYVINALGGRSRESLRFSFGRTTRENDIDAAIAALRDIFDKYAKI
ncbi:MAG TPA: cysteine desulfurase family protein [Candidatus Paceibacterota bacterium]|nr:cysteine desulfurase family protein [Candidatus Paceibacterota bacterium]